MFEPVVLIYTALPKKHTISVKATGSIIPIPNTIHGKIYFPPECIFKDMELEISVSILIPFSDNICLVSEKHQNNYMFQKNLI